jgi:hypothetical protein
MDLALNKAEVMLMMDGGGTNVRQAKPTTVCLDASCPSILEVIKFVAYSLLFEKVSRMRVPSFKGPLTI